MKFFLACLTLLASSVAAKISSHPVASKAMEMNDIKADSSLGQKLLSQARQLENNNWGDYMQTWVAGYSIKFQGCHHVSQWNEDADEDNDVRIATKRLVRFRLCPSDSCSANSSKGCNTGYGDYIIDMNTYLAAYFEAKQEYQAFKCEYLQENVCYCDGDNQNGGENSEEMCLWDCYKQHNMEGVCMENNPYNNNNNGGNDGGNAFEVANYLECTQFAGGNGNNNNNNNNNNGWDGSYYIGPYCASQGGEIHMGMFLDDSCTTFADNSGGRQTFYNQNALELPYGKSNMIDLDCFSCAEPQENNNDGNDAQDNDNVAEICETIYTAAGKCEQNLAYGTVFEANNNACNYMEGIKIVRKDGSVVTAEAKANKTASVFIGLFTVAFVLLSAYVYYLKTKLDRASVQLNE